MIQVKPVHGLQLLGPACLAYQIDFKVLPIDFSAGSFSCSNSMPCPARLANCAWLDLHYSSPESRLPDLTIMEYRRN